MNDHIPDAGKMVCPHCGAKVMLCGSGTTFMCDTWVSKDGTVDQSRECTSRQRDQLRARVEELEAARTKAAANSLANMLAHEEALRRINELHSECDRYMSAATAWKMYADRLEIAGDTLATVTVRNGRSHEQWHAAKETKP
jgi:hypothetical protein